MRSFVVCIVLAGSALVSASWSHVPGVPLDTPEVAAAKAAHLAALAGASAGGYAGGAADDGQWRDDTHQYNAPQNYGQEDDGQWRDDSHIYNNGLNGDDDGQWRGDNSGAWAGHNSGAWNGQNSGAWAGHNSGAWAAPGHLINGETPEVAAARAAHLSAHAAASSHGRWRRSLHAINPNALPVPLDTAIVAHAKQAQLIQQASEGTRNVLGGGVPLALPADTHEVAAGKQAHAIAHASQAALTSHGVIAAHGVVAQAPAVAVSAPVLAAAPAVAVAAPAVAAHSVAWAAPAVAIQRVVPAAALRYDTQLVAPGVIGAHSLPIAATLGLHH